MTGSSIAPVPLVEHAAASRLLARLAEAGADLASFAGETADALLSSLADGSAIATLALRPVDSSEAENLASSNEASDLPVSSQAPTAPAMPTRLSASPRSDFPVLSHAPIAASVLTARLSPAGAVANIFLALCDGDLLAVSSQPPLVSLPNTADLPIANREIPIVSSEVATLASGTDAVSHFRRAVSEWQALTATAICGLGQRALQIGVDYALERHQFDRPIGSFQAVQHGLADAATELEAAYYLCQRSLWMLDAEDASASQLFTSRPYGNTLNDNPTASSKNIPAEPAAPDAQTFAAMAFLFTSEAAQRAAAASLHYHGGYGYAEEYDIGLYYRRAKGWSLIYDSPAREYQRLADILLGPKTAV